MAPPAAPARTARTCERCDIVDEADLPERGLASPAPNTIVGKLQTVDDALPDPTALIVSGEDFERKLETATYRARMRRPTEGSTASRGSANDPERVC